MIGGTCSILSTSTRFHSEMVPQLVAGERSSRGDVPAAARRVRSRSGSPTGAAWTYSVGDHGIQVRPGDEDARTVIALSEADWCDFVNEARTCFGLLYAGLVSFPRGDFEAFDRWEPVLRALFDGRPPYDPDKLEGLDLARSFLVDEAGEAGEFLRRAGFAHIRGVFGETEVGVVRAEVERMQAAARPIDGRSWWAKDSTGADVCCRLIYATLSSEVLADFVDDERFARLAALGGAEVQPAPDRLDGVELSC